MRVSHEPTSGIHHQAIRVTTVSVVACDALLSMQPGASLTTWCQARSMSSVSVEGLQGRNPAQPQKATPKRDDPD